MNYQKLFNYMRDEHGVTLLESDMREIVDIVNEKSYRKDIGGRAIKPPLGLTPKKFYDEQVKIERFDEVCGAISRYYDAGLKINIEWIDEYNELVELVGKLSR